MIIGVDFDGTVVTHEYPEVGRDIGAVPVLKKLVERGHNIILFTMRSHKKSYGRDTLKDAEDWFTKNDIPLFGVNENPTQRSWTDSPKPHCNIYIDDAALGIPTVDNPDGRPYVDWPRVEELLKEKGVLEDDEEPADDADSERDRIVKEGVTEVLRGLLI
jgi:hypothetical protein